MPWTCKPCGALITRDDLFTCSSCKRSKSEWTLEADKTRSMVVAGHQVGYLRGVGRRELARAPGAWGGRLVEAEVAIVFAQDVLQELADEGLMPAPQDVLVVRLRPRPGSRSVDLGVTLTIEHGGGEAESLPPFQPHDPPAAQVDARFVFVYGHADGAPRPDFPGLHVVDVTDERTSGLLTFAPSITVQALKRPERTLPTRADEFVYSY